MSSSYVRTEFKNYISANIGSETLIDLSGEYREIKELLADESIASGEVWTGIEFIAGDEIPITIGSDNTKGKYRETGAVYLHIVGLARLGTSGNAATLARAEALRDKLRGKRLGSIFVESITPPQNNDGGTFNFGQGYSSISFLVEYMNDKDL
jgi:hypothetical protein